MDQTKDKSKNTVNFAVLAELSIAKQIFEAAIFKDNGAVTLKAGWKSNGEGLSLSALLDDLKIPSPEFLDSLKLNSVNLAYNIDNSALSMNFNINDVAGLEINSKKENEVYCYAFKVHLDTTLYFSRIPILDKMLSANDGIRIVEITARKSGDRGFSIEAKLEMTLGGKQTAYAFNWESDERVNNISTQDSANAGMSQPKWVDINKSFKIVAIHRLGIIFADGRFTVLVDASFSLSVLSLEFYELYLSTKIPPDLDEFKFGLSGLLVSFNKPPLALSGGLYKTADGFYNGEIGVKLSNFSLKALGSYGELSSGEKSFFIYLMLSYALGGPPFFFVTGLAAGFGLNRKFIWPELKKVREFPFVKAALKDSDSKLKADSTPSNALNLLSKYLQPSAGDYFITAGVAFKSFNMLNSFALLTVAFGNNLQIGLLGISELSLPPNLTSSENPIAYAQLVLKAIYDNNEGSFKVDAMLTEESYLFDKNCKLTGGFAFYLWNKGPNKGDFVVTLGGLWHPAYKKSAHPNYPEVDKLGINWRISKQLSVSGNAYFGLTPSCLMAGGGLSIVYESGRIKAWLSAKLDMLIQWKPFYYNIDISIALGASYRGLLTTYKLQICADLHIEGPNFSGKLHVEWFIISFTIKFGGSAKKPSKLNWKDFYESFLPKEIPQQTGTVPVAQSANSKTLSSVRICNGIISELKEAGKNIILVNGQDLCFETRCEMPSTSLSFNGKQVFEYRGKLGIVPMGIKNYCNKHIVSITNLENSLDAVTIVENYVAKEILENVSSGLWLNNDPTLNDGVIPDVPVGIRVTIKKADISLEGLPTSGSYSLEDLKSSEIIEKSLTKSTLTVPVNKHRINNAYESVKATFSVNSKRDGSFLSDIAACFGTDKKLDIRNIGNYPDSFFIDEPLVCTTGAKCDFI